MPKSKKIRAVICIILVWVVFTFFSALLFNTYNWLGVSYAHIILATTDKNQCRFGTKTYLVKDFHKMLEDLEQKGWNVVKQLESEEQAYLLQKESDKSVHKEMTLKKHAITGYDVVILGGEITYIILSSD